MRREQMCRVLKKKVIRGQQSLQVAEHEVARVLRFLNDGLQPGNHRIPFGC